MSKRFLMLPAFYGLIIYNIYAQGCSDAGFCTMGAMRPNQPFSGKLNIKIKSVEISQYTGVSHQGVAIFATTADVNVGITNKLVLQCKVPYMVTTGALGSKNGIGDISISLTQNVVAKEKLQINLTIGSKIASNNSDLKENGLPLPMYYQTSLGTYDFVIGASLISKKWLFAIGFQQPFNSNKNEFVWGAWKKSADSSEVFDYPVSKNLKRGSDVMLRVERNFRFARWNYFAGLLPIYRFQPDVITSVATNERIKVSQSTGLALSFIGGAGYQITAKSSLKLLAGLRILKRESNPDGLSREYVVTLGYQYRF